MAQGISYSIAGKYNPKGEKAAIQGIEKIKEASEKLSGAMKKINMAIGGFAISKAVEGISKVVSGSTEEFRKNNAALSQLQNSIKNNIALSTTSLKNLVKTVDSVNKHKLFTDSDMLNAANYSAQLGLNEKQIKKVLKASVDMASSGIMPLDQAVENLSKTFNGNLGELAELHPELNNLTEEQLANGDAVDILEGKYKNFGDTMANTFEGKDIAFKNSFAELQSSIGGALEPIKASFQGKLVGVLNKITDWINEHRIDIVKFFFNLPEIIKVAASSGWKIIQQTFTSEGLKNLFSFIGNSLVNTIHAAFKTIKALAKAGIDNIFLLLNFTVGNTVRKIQDKLGELGNSVITGINEIITNALENNFIGGLYEKLTGNFAWTETGIDYRFSTNNADENKTWDETTTEITKNTTEALTTFGITIEEGWKEQKKIFKEFTNTYTDVIKDASADMTKAIKQDLPKELQDKISPINTEIIGTSSNSISQTTNQDTNYLNPDYQLVPIDDLQLEPLQPIYTKEEQIADENLISYYNKLYEADKTAEESNTTARINDSIQTAMGSLFSSFGEVGGLIQSTINAITTGIGPWGIIIQLIAQFVGALSQASSVLGTLTNFISVVFTQVAEMLAPMVDKLLMPLLNCLFSLGVTIGSLLMPVFMAVTTIMEPILKLVSTLVVILTPFIQVLGQLLSIMAAFDPILTIVSATIKTIGDLIIWLYNKIIRFVFNGIIWIFSQISNFFIKMYNAIADALNSIVIFKKQLFNLTTKEEIKYEDKELKEIDYSTYDKGDGQGASMLPENTNTTGQTTLPNYVFDGEIPNFNSKVTNPTQNLTSANNNSASYTAKRDIIINIDVGQLVGQDGMREFSLMIRDEIRAAEALGR